MLAKYAKAWVAAGGVLINVLYSYNAVRPNVWVSALIAALTVLGVHQVPNA